MIRKLNNLLLANVPLKLISLLLGYAFWYIFSSAHTMSIWLTIPVCFYAMPEQMKITGPEQITLKIAGKREYLRSLDLKSLAAHINAQQLSVGLQKITINEDMLFLPDTIKLVHCYPITIDVINEFDEQTQGTTQGKDA